jgi:hypothetical protein
MGGDRDSHGPTLPQHPRFGREEILALCAMLFDHERAKSELRALMPEDAKEAIGHGVRGRRSRSGAVSFDVLSSEVAHAPVQ